MPSSTIAGRNGTATTLGADTGTMGMLSSTMGGEAKKEVMSDIQKQESARPRRGGKQSKRRKKDTKKLRGKKTIARAASARKQQQQGQQGVGNHEQTLLFSIVAGHPEEELARMNTVRAMAKRMVQDVLAQGANCG